MIRKYFHIRTGERGRIKGMGRRDGVKAWTPAGTNNLAWNQLHPQKTIQQMRRHKYISDKQVCSRHIMNSSGQEHLLFTTEINKSAKLDYENKNQETTREKNCFNKKKTATV